MAALSASSSPAISESPTCNFLPIQQNHYHSLSKVSFGFTPKPKFGLFSKNLSGRILTVKAQLNKVALDGSNHAPSPSHEKSGLPAQEKKNDESSSESSPAALVSEERVSEFLSQVAGLVKLVDSRDIVELQLKQLDCEILIRKQEAIPQPQIPNPTHVVAMQPPPPPVASAPAPVSSPATPRPALPAPAPAATSAKPSLPPLKSPMSGTFYRSPAPGEPPFVKVGDKVKKGQVICIIEAMKLMNEIEADQSGTIIEILAEDGKPVSLDTPLLVIQP